MVGLVAIFTTGCGDSRDEFVSLGNNNIGTGNLVFRFVRVQTTDTVPLGTTTLRFDLYSGTPPSAANFVETRTVAYADVVTLTDVPANVTTVVVTAFGADNTPLVTLQGDAPVEENGTVEVDLNDAVPVTFDSINVTPDPADVIYYGLKPHVDTQLVVTGTFSNGSVVDLPINNTTTSFQVDTGFADISPTGLVGHNEPGNGTVTCSYTIGSTTRTDTFLTRAYAYMPSIDFGVPVITSTGDFNGYYNVRFYDAGNGILNVNNTANTTYAFADPAPTGLSIDSATGKMTSTGTTPLGSFNVSVTWVDTVRTGASGITFSDCIEFTVADGPQ